MTYNVFGGTLNLAQSINHRLKYPGLIKTSAGPDAVVKMWAPGKLRNDAFCVSLKLI